MTINNQVKYLENQVSEDDIKKFSRIYSVHKYWSRKPWHPIAECIQKYSQKKELVLDMFLGSGVTALESICLERNFIGFDLNPMSIFITNCTLQQSFDEDKFVSEIKILESKLSNIADSLYIIKDKCKICSKNFTLQHINIGPAFKDKETIYAYCTSCGKKSKIKRKATKKEISASNKSYNISKWVPKTTFPKNFYKDRFSYKGVTKVTDMYTKRNLYFLSELLFKIKNLDLEYKNLFLLAFSNTILHASKLKGENVRPLNVNNYWIPDDYFEENPWLRFKDRLNLIIQSKRVLKEKISDKIIGNYKIYNKSCFKTNLKDESIDYILTDPPYGETIQYSELSFMWNSWLNTNFDNNEEVIINPKQHKGSKQFFELMEKSISEASRVLKKNKKYTLCFQNKEFKIWSGLLNIFKKYNFVLEEIEIVNTKGNSYNKNWAHFSPKNDLYLTFTKKHYKPTHNKVFSLEKVINSLKITHKTSDPATIYDTILITLIDELYFNEFQIDLSKLTIKQISELMEE